MNTQNNITEINGDDTIHAYYYEGTPGSALQTLVSGLIIENRQYNRPAFAPHDEPGAGKDAAMIIFNCLEIECCRGHLHPAQDAGRMANYINMVADGRSADAPPPVGPGAVTMLTVVKGKDGHRTLLIAEGELSSQRFAPTKGISADVFLKRWEAEGAAPDFALGAGHHAKTLVEAAKIFGVGHTVIAQPRSEAGAVYNRNNYIKHE